MTQTPTYAILPLPGGLNQSDLPPVLVTPDELADLAAAGFVKITATKIRSAILAELSNPGHASRPAR